MPHMRGGQMGHIGATYLCRSLGHMALLTYPEKPGSQVVNDVQGPLFSSYTAKIQKESKEIYHHITLQSIVF